VERHPFLQEEWGIGEQKKSSGMVTTLRNGFDPRNLILLFVTLLVSVGAWQGAWAQATCTTSRSVVAVGEAATETEAIAVAIAQAISQTRGFFVSAREYLKERFLATLREGRESAEYETEYYQEVVQRYSGLVLSYKVLNKATSVLGLKQIELEVQICLDPGILIVASEEFVSALKPLLPTYWKVYPQPPSKSTRELFDQGFALGASLIAEVKETVAFEDIRVQGQNLIRANLNGALSVYDLKTMEVVYSEPFRINGVGTTRKDAYQDALSKVVLRIAEPLTKFISDTPFAEQQQKSLVRILLFPVKRRSSVEAMKLRIEKLPFVTRLVSVDYAESERRLSVVLELAEAGSACRLAEVFREQMSGIFRLQLRNCSDDLIDYLVIYE
jgi:hypothetical protein